jgi:hypothetical protein
MDLGRAAMGNVCDRRAEDEDEDGRALAALLQVGDGIGQ